MAFPDELKKKIIENLEPDKMNCPLCGNKNFTIEDNIYVFPTLELETKNVDIINVFPAILISCDSCHHTLTFHAVRAGIIDK